MTFHDPHMAEGGKAVLVTGLFGDAERVISLDRPMAIAEIIEAHNLEFRLPTIALMDGDAVMRGEWAVRMVSAQEVVAFIAIPGGGEGGGDNTGKMIIGMVAAVALAVAAPMIGGLVAGALFTAGSTGFAITSALVATALTIGGSMLLNALMPADVANEQQSAEQVYSVNAAGNNADPLGIIPVLYGRLRYPPRYASRAYTEYAGNDQYLYQLFCITAGKASIEKIEIGDTEAWNSVDGYSATFSDLETEIIQPGGNITLFPANVVTATEVSGQAVPDPAAVLGPFVVNDSGTTIDKISCDFVFPAGLFTQSDRTITNNSIPLRAQYRQIDDSGTATGSWENVFQTTYNLATRTPQRFTVSKAVSSGRYEVKFFAEAAFDGDGGNGVNKCVWAGLRGYLTDFVTPPDCTLLAVKIKANEQITQSSAGQFFVTAQRHLPTYTTGGGWAAESATNSIAWAAADLLRNTDYSIGLTSGQFDVSQLETLEANWSGRADSFNAIFDRTWTLADALKAVLRAGRTTYVRMGGTIGFNRLEAKSIKRAVFTENQVVRGSFGHKIVLFDEDNPDSVKASYLDEEVWDTREVVGSLSSVGSVDPQKVQYFGITNHDQAWREAVTDAAINAYQREFVTLTAEWEGKLLVRGEPIVINHPFIEGIASAELKDLTGQVLTLDRELGAPSGSGYVIIRTKTGQEWGPCLIDSVATNQITLNLGDRLVVDAGMGALAGLLPGARSEAATVTLCEGDVRPFNGLVVSATPSANGQVDILAVIDAPEVYAADLTETIPSPWVVPTLPPATIERPLLLGLFGELRSGVGEIFLDAVWQPSPGAETGYVAQTSYDSGASWTPIYTGVANRLSVAVLPQPLKLRVASIGLQQGPWAELEFLADVVPDYQVTGADIAANAIDLANLSSDLQGVINSDAVTGLLNDRILQVMADMEEQAGANALAQTTHQERSELLFGRTQSSVAAVIRETKAQAGVNEAFASDLLLVSSEIDAIGADALINLETTANVVGVSATATIATLVEAGGDTASGALIIKTGYVDGTLKAQIFLKSDDLFISNGTDSANFIHMDGTGAMTLQEMKVNRITSLDGTSFILDGVTGNFSFGT